MYIDFHTHKPIHEANKLVIEMISAHITPKYMGLFTVGYHPWWATAPIEKAELELLETQLKNKNCLALGECGLDKLKGAERAIQEEVFYQQIELANKLNKPLIVHCVRQYDRVLDSKKKYGKTPWVIHGYRRNNLLAKNLIDAGIYLSVSPFENMNFAFVETLKYLPADRFFIETDSEYSHSIMERYAIMASTKNIDNELLKLQLAENFERFFGIKIIDLI